MTQSAGPTQPSQPNVSVIICCYTMERLNDIHEVVSSVLGQTLKAHEVILSVDHNEELFDKLASIPGIKVVHNTGVRGLSETRNAGIRAAGGDIVAFIDDDAVAEPDWLENLVKPFQVGDLDQRAVVAVGGRAVPLWLSGSRPSWFAEELDWIVGCTYKGLPVETLNLEPGTLNLELRTIRNVPGCNMAFRKEIFQQAGLFRSEMGRVGKAKGVAEEPELCIRVKRTLPSAFIIYEPAATIHHKVPSWRLSLRYLTQRSYDEGFYKNLVEKFSQTAQQTLSTESSYLRYLLFTSIPNRLKRFYEKGSLSQLGAIIISLVATGTGYLIGKIKT